MDERVPVEDCWPEMTPLGPGVRVGQVTWTSHGPGVWTDQLSAEERYAALERLLEDPRAGDKIYLGAFTLLPPEGMKFSIMEKQ